MALLHDLIPQLHHSQTKDEKTTVRNQIIELVTHPDTNLDEIDRGGYTPMHFAAHVCPY